MDLYFKAVPKFGDLNLDYVFFDGQYPILFTAINKKNELFIVLNFETRGYQKWLISKTDYLNLMYMIYNQIPVVDVFKNDHHKKCIAVWDYTNKTMSYEIIEFANIDPVDLPASDFYFEADAEEIKSFLNHFNAAEMSNVSSMPNYFVYKTILEEITKSTKYVNNMDGQAVKLIYSTNYSYETQSKDDTTGNFLLGEAI